MKYLKTYLLLLIVISYSAMAQNRLLPIKEKYDYLGITTNTFNNKYFSGADAPDFHNNCNSDLGVLGRLGDNTAHVLESFIKMYETTSDKAYLIK